VLLVAINISVCQCNTPHVLDQFCPCLRVKVVVHKAQMRVQADRSISISDRLGNQLIGHPDVLKVRQS